MIAPIAYPRTISPNRVRAVYESADPGRRPRVGDRVFWHGMRVGLMGVFARREGTVTAVYPDPTRASESAASASPAEVLFNIEWDAPTPGNPAPWSGTSYGLRGTVLHTRGWGWVR